MTTTAPGRPLDGFAYISFDLVGTLIDFERAITQTLTSIAEEAGVSLDAEEALAIYRTARTQPEAGLFPDDLGRCYGIIAARTGLPDRPELRQALVDAAGDAPAFPDSADALARLKRDHKLIAMTNARRWAFENYARTLGQPFWAALTTDDTGTEKPDPAFFDAAFDLVRGDGGDKADILHTAQSQYHDIGVSRALGMTNAWIERRHGQPGYGGSIEPEAFTRPDYHFLTLAELADAMERASDRTSADV
ncbi:MAG: HAD-IA family hydrolase [Pseudomonadota bacterium]|nr:HAD-IA family hydrolase [Pseudomonadota bacterium]